MKIIKISIVSGYFLWWIFGIIYLFTTTFSLHLHSHIACGIELLFFFFCSVGLYLLGYILLMAIEKYSKTKTKIYKWILALPLLLATMYFLWIYITIRIHDSPTTLEISTVTAFPGITNNISSYDELELYQRQVKKVIVDSAVIGKEFSFVRKIIDTSYHPDTMEIKNKYVYMGKISPRKGGDLKFVKSIRDWRYLPDGTNHSRGAIDIYSENNIWIGYYGFWSSAELPSHIDKTSLVFDFKNEFCNQKTAINFYDSIPKMMQPSCERNTVLQFPFRTEYQ